MIYFFVQIKGVFVQLDELVDQIELDQTRRSRLEADEPFSVNIFATSHEQSATRINGQFVQSQLLLDCLLRMKSNPADLNELISRWKKENRDNKRNLAVLREFQEEYTADHAVKWYTRELCLYQTLNQALREQNVEVLFELRFFIRDLRLELARISCTMPVKVYRGQLLSKQELTMLKHAVGYLISMNSFISTTLCYDVAYSFIDFDLSDDCERVLFEINADPKLDGIKPFADITSYGKYTTENEVLFAPQSIFRLNKIDRQDRLWVIQMTLTNDKDHNLKAIVEHMKNQYGHEETNLLSFGHVLRDMGKLKEAEKYYQDFLSQQYHSDHDIANCYYSLGVTAYEQGKHKQSLDYYQISLVMKKKVDDPSFVDNYNGIAAIYQKLGDTKKALEWISEALAFTQQKFGDGHPDVGMYFNTMACIFFKEKKYQDAFDYSQKSITIWNKHLPEDHPNLAHAHNNMGEICLYLGRFDSALEHLHISLEIKRNSLPSQHSDVAETHENLGLVHEKMVHVEQALLHYKKAISIYKAGSRSTQHRRDRIQQRIRRLLSRLK
jgi:tetratricopeptide (TPR) repeat protein